MAGDFTIKIPQIRICLQEKKKSKTLDNVELITILEPY
jgi:hypothetical protein